MLKVNNNMLSMILATIPYNKFNGDFINNIFEATKHMRTGIIDAKEVQLLDSIEKMTSMIEEGVELTDEELIRVSTPTDSIHMDILARFQTIKPETRQYVSKVIDMFAVKGDVINSAFELTEVLEELQNSPNNAMLEKMEKVANVVTRTVNKIDSKKTASDKKLLIIGKKIKGLDNVIGSLRHSDAFALRTGIAAIDDLADLFRPQKLYWFTALSGGFKSGTLENITLGFSRNNKDLPIKNGMENAVLHITLENDLLQVFKRFIDHTSSEKFYSNKYLSELTDNEIKDLAYHRLAPKDDGDMSIIVQQSPRYALRPEDIDRTVVQLRKENINVCAIVLDYCDLLEKPRGMVMDTNDSTPIVVKKAEALKLLSQKLEVPVISAGQFNRQGEDIVKTQIKRSASPLYSELSAAHLAGGFGLKFHIDVGIFLYKGTYDGIECLHMKLDKQREANESTEDKSKAKDVVGVYRFCKFKSNAFAISPDPNDCYTDIRQMAPDADGGIVASAFKSNRPTISEELLAKVREAENSKRNAIDELGF